MCKFLHVSLKTCENEHYCYNTILMFKKKLKSEIKSLNLCRGDHLCPPLLFLPHFRLHFLQVVALRNEINNSRLIGALIS